MGRQFDGFQCSCSGNLVYSIAAIDLFEYHGKNMIACVCLLCFCIPYIAVDLDLSKIICFICEDHDKYGRYIYVG